MALYNRTDIGRLFYLREEGGGGKDHNFNVSDRNCFCIMRETSD